MSQGKAGDFYKHPVMYQCAWENSAEQQVVEAHWSFMVKPWDTKQPRWKVCPKLSVVGGKDHGFVRLNSKVQGFSARNVWSFDAPCLDPRRMIWVWSCCMFRNWAWLSLHHVHFSNTYPLHGAVHVQTRSASRSPAVIFTLPLCLSGRSLRVSQNSRSPN